MGRTIGMLGVAVVGVATLTSAASASSISADLLQLPGGLNPGTNVMTVQFIDPNNTSHVAMYSGAFIGQLNWQAAGPSTNLTQGLNQQLNNVLGAGGTFSSFCIEGLQDVIFGNHETWNLGVVTLDSAPAPGPAMGLSKAAQITELWDRHYADVLNLNPTIANENATAFQLAIWEIVGDGVTPGTESAANFGVGFFQASGDTTAINTAVSWINQISGTGFTPTYTLYALSDPGNTNQDGIQDQVFAVQNGGATPPVPLPAALPAGLALLSGLGVAKFLRRRS
jgi:hypothetical protein